MNKLKKTAFYILCIMFLLPLQAMGENSSCLNKCPQAYEQNPCSKFLCTEAELDEVFNRTGLNDLQLCAAQKLQDKYERETLSVNDRLTYEESVLNDCAADGGKNMRMQKKKIKELHKLRKKICRNYEQQFKAMLSRVQLKKYKKCIRQYKRY